ncbi:MAG: hypothetical protein V4787_01650 [Pseudomonadota bacterium]
MPIVKHQSRVSEDIGLPSQSAVEWELKSVLGASASSLDEEERRLATVSCLLGESWKGDDVCPEEDFMGIPPSFQALISAALDADLRGVTLKKKSSVKARSSPPMSDEAKLLRLQAEVLLARARKNQIIRKLTAGKPSARATSKPCARASRAEQRPAAVREDLRV